MGVYVPCRMGVDLKFPMRHNHKGALAHRASRMGTSHGNVAWNAYFNVAWDSPIQGKGKKKKRKGKEILFFGR